MLNLFTVITKCSNDLLENSKLIQTYISQRGKLKSSGDWKLITDTKKKKRKLVQKYHF